MDWPTKENNYSWRSFGQIITTIFSSPSLPCPNESQSALALHHWASICPTNPPLCSFTAFQSNNYWLGPDIWPGGGGDGNGVCDDNGVCDRVWQKYLSQIFIHTFLRFDFPLQIYSDISLYRFLDTNIFRCIIFYANMYSDIHLFDFFFIQIYLYICLYYFYETDIFGY